MTVIYQHHGIKTTFDHRDYRSRLEARWAAFFAYIGWPFEYEPFDLKGWIPDFGLFGAKETVLVEVKPIAVFDEDVADELDAVETKHEILLLGCTVNATDAWGETSIGWLGERYWQDDTYATSRLNWGNAMVGVWSECGTLGFCHETGSFHDRISGKHDGGCYGQKQELHGVTIPQALKLAWATAGNRVQWQKR